MIHKMAFPCDFCGNTFVHKQNLNSHQKKAKYCLKIQGVKGVEFGCTLCDRIFHSKYECDRHEKTCKKSKLVDFLKKQVEYQKKQVDDQKIEIKDQKIKIADQKIEIAELRIKNKMLQDLQDNYKELSITAIKSTNTKTSTKNIQINNYIKNMSPLLENDIKSNVPMLTLEHHVMGAEGYAQYALEFPFKDKIVCVDVSRNKIKYKNEEGDIIEDVGFKKDDDKVVFSIKGS